MAANKFDVDDLIKEYIVYRTENGYEPKFTVTHFMKLLERFKTRMDVDDTLDDGLEMIKRFFDRKIAMSHSYYNYVDNTRPRENWELRPAVIFEYSEKDKDYIVKAGNYLYGSYSASIWVNYWSPSQVRMIIEEFLSDEPKRVLDEDGPFTKEDLQLGKCIAAKIIKAIWTGYINGYIDSNRWPSQCNNINKYLIEMDLATIINIPSIKKELFELYNVIAKRIAILHNQDKDLEINSSSGCLLGHQNYNLLINGYEKLFHYAYSEYRKHLSIDSSKLKISETYEVGPSYYDEDEEYVTNTSKISNDSINQLVLSIEKASKTLDEKN